MNLFDANSTSFVSKPFRLHKQSTVYAVGLTGTDSVQFEMCLLDDVPVPQIAGCLDVCDPGFPTSELKVIGATKLTCACPSAGIRHAVALTAGMSHVVLDNPQNIWVRAVYTGTNLGDSVVWVEASDIENVTDGMRSCC